MIIKKLEISNFRNYKNLEIEFSPNINIIYGKNAQGKTNLIESIYFLSKLKSHRISSDYNLIKNNSSNLYVKGIIENNNTSTKYQVNLSNDLKVFKIDNNIIKKVNNYISNIDIIIFYPEDLNLIKGSPFDRREFLNDEISQLYNNYFSVLNDYNKLLKMKNDYLKNTNYNIDDNYLNTLNNYFVDKGIMIIKIRKKFIDKINIHCKNIYKKIMNLDNFFIKYIPSINFESYDLDQMKIKFLEELKINKFEEIRLKTSIVGPHRDDFKFILKDLDLKKYGSQGQQRVAVLALKLSEIEIFKKYKFSTPILLLDDIFSELDDIKKNNLLSYITKDMQVIITTTDLNNIDKKLITKSNLIEIQKGTIKNKDEVEKDGKK